MPKKRPSKPKPEDLEMQWLCIDCKKPSDTYRCAECMKKKGLTRPDDGGLDEYNCAV